MAKAMQMTPAEVRAMEFREMMIYSVFEEEFQEEQEKRLRERTGKKGGR